MKKILTFILSLIVVISITTIDTKAAEGIHNIGLTWTTGSDTGGTYYTATKTIDNIGGIDYFAGYVANDTLPMYITIRSNWTLYGTVYQAWHLPNEYLIELTPLNPVDFDLTLYIGDVTPETLLFDETLSFQIQDDPNVEWYITFKYYTAGMIKNLWELAMTQTANLEADYETIFQRGWNEGFALGEDQGFDTGYDLGTDDTAYDIFIGGIYDYGYNPIDSYDYEQAVFSAYENGFTGLGYVESLSYSYLLGYDNGEQGLDGMTNLVTWVFMPFDLFSKELFYGVTIGGIALLSITIGIMSFYMGFRGKKK